MSTRKPKLSPPIPDFPEKRLQLATVSVKAKNAPQHPHAWNVEQTQSLDDLPRSAKTRLH